MRSPRPLALTVIAGLSLSFALAAWPGRAAADDKSERAEAEREKARAEAEREKARAEAERDRERAREEAERARERAQEARERAQEARERGREIEREHGHEIDCDDCDERGRAHGGDQADPPRPTTVKVKRPVRFTVEVVTADVEIVAAGSDTVSISAKNCGANELGLDVDGDEIEAEFDEWGSCQGPVIVRVPVGSSVEVGTVEGDIKLKGSFKEVEASTVAGGVDLEAADTAEIDAVQGNIRIGKARHVEVESVAGNVDITTDGLSPLVDVETVSGNVRWSGTCGKGCRLAIESFQGRVKLGFDAKSSFELRFASDGGKLVDKLGLKTTTSGKNVKGYSPTRSTFGKGEGSVRVETYQSDLDVAKK